MDVQDAHVITIPRQTRSEIIENDYTQIKEIFQGEDLSGLDLEYRRGRKISIDVEDYFKNLDYNPNIEDDDGQLDGPGVFKKNYKMALQDDEPLIIEEEKIDTIGEVTTNNEEIIQTNHMTPVYNRKQSKVLVDKVTKLEPLKIDLGIDIKSRLLTNKLSPISACWKTENTFFSCPSLSNVKVYTRPGSLIMSRSNNFKSKIYSLGSLENADLLKDIDNTQVLDQIQKLNEQNRRTFTFGQSIRKSINSSDNSFSDDTNLIPIFLKDYGAIVLEFRPLIEDSDELQDIIYQEKLERIHLYRMSDIVDSMAIFDSVSLKLDSLLKQEGSYMIQRFLYKLSNLETPKNLLSHKDDFEVRSVSKFKHKIDANNEDEDMDVSNNIVNRRRSRYVDFDYEEEADDEEYIPCFTRERSGGGRDNEGSFSL